VEREVSALGTRVAYASPGEGTGGIADSITEFTREGQWWYLSSSMSLPVVRRPYGNGHRILAPDKTLLDAVLKKLPAIGIEPFKVGFNTWEDRAAYPHYILIMTGPDEKPLRPHQLTSLDQIIASVNNPRLAAAGTALPEQPTRIAPSEAAKQDPQLAVLVRAEIAQIGEAQRKCLDEIAELKRFIAEQLDERIAKVTDSVQGLTESEVMKRAEALAAGDKIAAEELVEDARIRLQQVETLQKELHRITNERDIARSLAEARNTEISELRAHLEMSGALEEPSETLLHNCDLLKMLSYLQSLWPDRLEVLDEARRGAREFDNHNDPSPEENERLWIWLRSVPDVVFSLMFIEHAGKPDTLYTERTGFALAMTEGSQTQKNPRLMRLREFQVGNQVVRALSHIKLTVCRRHLRIYFCRHPEQRKLCICYIGEHLETDGTRKMC
jgi:hypothetical protein